jgi:hypothetical protein
VSSVDAQIKSKGKTICILQDLVVVARVGVHRFLCVGVSDPAINDLHGSDRVLRFLSNELLAAKTPLIRVAGCRMMVGRLIKCIHHAWFVPTPE